MSPPVIARYANPSRDHPGSEPLPGELSLGALEDRSMSIVRIGLGETKHFSEGYEHIFGKKKGSDLKKAATRAKTGSAKKAKKSRRK
jgi:hypothetical protein